jgi:hypothetical protein
MYSMGTVRVASVPFADAALRTRLADQARFLGAGWEEQVDFSAELEEGGREMRVKPTEPKKPYLNTAVLEVDGVVQHSKADGAAFVHPCTVTFDDGPTRRGVAVVAQRDGQVSRRILPLTFAEDGTIGSQPPVYQDEGAPEEPWIGVPPPEGVTISWQLNKPIHGGVLPEG